MGQMHTASLSEVMGSTANIHSQFSQLKNSTQRWVLASLFYNACFFDYREVQTLQKELSMMSEQIQTRLDEQQRTFKSVEEQLNSNLKKKEDECREVIRFDITLIQILIFNSFKKSLAIAKLNWRLLRPKCSWLLLIMKNDSVRQTCLAWK